MALVNSKIDTMAQYLGERFYIPNYQRDYSWEEDELSDFWEDLKHTTNNNNGDEHFFGQIVVHVNSDDNKKYIIDGQQRTISSVIFLRALQLCFIEIYNETSLNEANQKNSIISYKYIGEDDNSLNLTLGEQDAEFFKEYIQTGSPNGIPRQKKKSQEKLRRAFVFFDEKLHNSIAEQNDPKAKIDILQKYLETFTQRFKILYLEADKLDEAFIIFETLNARGRDLETADLLKNFIFSKASKINDIDEAQNKWDNMIVTLDRIDPTKYIRHYWNSCHPFAREKELYRNISKFASTPRDCDDLLNDLQKLSKYYHDLANPNEDIAGFRNLELIKRLIALKTLKASTYYPIVLAMLEVNFSEEDIAKVLQRIEVFIFRNFTICGLVANSAEVLFAKIAVSIYEKELSTVGEICTEIDKNIVSDEEFKDAFSRWTAGESSKEIVRYILRKIHKNSNPTTEINIDNSEVHIEHIMPQDSSEWNVDDEMHEQYLWRLGNLALLDGRKNISISNKPFELKKEIYTKSFIEPNRDLGNYGEWNSEEIEDRQKKLAELAIKIWKK